MAAVVMRAPWITVLMTLAVAALTCLGVWLGMKISKELMKSGALKK